MLVGIDYGSKLAGTTVIAYNQGGLIYLQYILKKVDADKQILQFVAKHHSTIKAIGIDAPLSIPQAFYGNGNDFFYRTADRDLGAMSPMFLGGLTARAMSLCTKLSSNIIEVYPRARVRKIDAVETHYKKDLTMATDQLVDLLDLPIEQYPHSWHAFDAIIAWLITKDYQDGVADTAGRKKEGFIHY